MSEMQVETCNKFLLFFVIYLMNPYLVPKAGNIYYLIFGCSGPNARIHGENENAIQRKKQGKELIINVLKSIIHFNSFIKIRFTYELAEHVMTEPKQDQMEFKVFEKSKFKNFIKINF